MKTEEEFQEGNESNRHRDAQLKKRWVCGFKGKSLYSQPDWIVRADFEPIQLEMGTVHTAAAEKNWDQE